MYKIVTVTINKLHVVDTHYFRQFEMYLCRFDKTVIIGTKHIWSLSVYERPALLVMVELRDHRYKGIFYILFCGLRLSDPYLILIMQEIPKQSSTSFLAAFTLCEQKPADRAIRLICTVSRQMKHSFAFGTYLKLAEIVLHSLLNLLHNMCKTGFLMSK
jgi:hypothetical protein